MSGQWASVWQPSTLTYTPPENPSRNLQTLFAYVEARNSWHESPDSFLALFDDNLEHRILPQSLEKPVLNKKQYRELISGLLRFIKAYKMTLHDVIETEDTIVAHASSVTQGVYGTCSTSEYMITLRFAPPSEGELPKISYVKEFVDSLSSVEFFKEERRRAQLAKSQGSPSLNGSNGSD
ncbi:hypothetical protein K435DRAFT_849268 [Dendrothele bispora CBS 962.96]|uniref:SnoaL-like domain-containing protein n=1 Tax=Dendrothele bispora (strain CBS 962.96) TaxID=1314807 RepID=A0A4S8MSN9_DENBC|nr:hypothetical protein K435DRAFT_849268 [Dendrothele bispora CBS 962.96]